MDRLFRLCAATAVALAALAACPASVRADIIVLDDGTELEGEVTTDGDHYVIKGRFGTTTRVPKYRVVEIRKTESPRDKFRKKAKALEAKGAKAGADAWFELAGFAAEHNLKDEARKTARKVIKLDADHKGARKILGHVLHEGEWMPEEEAAARKGLVMVGGRWVTKEEAEEAKERRAERRSPARAPDEAGAAAKMIAVWETCSVCNGTKYEIWFPCNQCKRSDKPGHTYMGDHYRVCNRCKGKGQLPGIRCRHCRGIGKVNPEKPRKKPKERYIPTGYRICPACNGTGVTDYVKCLQCARSDQPGYTYMGDHYELCRKCWGTSKVPALQCGACQRSGLVRDK